MTRQFDDSHRNLQGDISPCEVSPSLSYLSSLQGDTASTESVGLWDSRTKDASDGGYHRARPHSQGKVSPAVKAIRRSSLCGVSPRRKLPVQMQSVAIQVALSDEAVEQVDRLSVQLDRAHRYIQQLKLEQRREALRRQSLREEIHSLRQMHFSAVPVPSPAGQRPSLQPVSMPSPLTHRHLYGRHRAERRPATPPRLCPVHSGKTQQIAAGVMTTRLSYHQDRSHHVIGCSRRRTPGSGNLESMTQRQVNSTAACACNTHLHKDLEEAYVRLSNKASETARLHYEVSQLQSKNRKTKQELKSVRKQQKMQHVFDLVQQQLTARSRPPDMPYTARGVIRPTSFDTPDFGAVNPDIVAALTSRGAGPAADIAAPQFTPAAVHGVSPENFTSRGYPTPTMASSNDRPISKAPTTAVDSDKARGLESSPSNRRRRIFPFGWRRGSRQQDAPDDSVSRPDRLMPGIVKPAPAQVMSSTAEHRRMNVPPLDINTADTVADEQLRKGIERLLSSSSDSNQSASRGQRERTSSRPVHVHSGGSLRFANVPPVSARGHRHSLAGPPIVELPHLSPRVETNRHKPRTGRPTIPRLRLPTTAF